MASGGSPDIADHNRTASATVRAIDPSVDSSSGSSPINDGRNPTTLQKLAGLRSDPPRSLPSAIGTMPVASAAAAPPEDPPALRERSNGLRVAPNTGLKVCEPAPNSGVFVLPTSTAPASRTRTTKGSSSPGTLSEKIGEP